MVDATSLLAGVAMATGKETRTDISVGGKRIVREPMRQGGHRGEFTEFEHAVPEAGTMEIHSKNIP